MVFFFLFFVVLSSPLLFLPTPIGVFFGKIKRMETGKLLRELRNYLKISVRDFSAMLGVVPTTIYWYENGGTLTESHIKDICQAFNVDKEYFKGTMTLEDAVDYPGYNHQRVELIRDMMNERGIKTNKELSFMLPSSPSMFQNSSLLFIRKTPVRSLPALSSTIILC